MAEEEKKNNNISNEPVSQKSSIIRWIAIAGIAIFLGIGGYVGWTVYARGTDSAPEKNMADAAKPREIPRLVFPIRSFIVNLMDQKGIGKKYLKVTMEIEVNDEASKKIVEKSTPQLSDMILLLLSSRSLNEINTLEGKLELKQSLVARMNQVLGEKVVQKVYFTEFVVQ